MFKTESVQGKIRRWDTALEEFMTSLLERRKAFLDSSEQAENKWEKCRESQYLSQWVIYAVQVK